MIKQKLIIIIIILALSANENSWACSCIEYYFPPKDLQELAEYSFIAHVTIIAETDLKRIKNAPTTGLLTIKINELFKGTAISQIREQLKNTSCDMGISVGEEWIFFGKIVNGEYTVGPCDRNRQYRAKDGERDWKYGRGVDELKHLQLLYKHDIKKFGDEIRKEYYPNGQLELEENYKAGLKVGERKLWYANGTLFCKQFYNNDALHGKSTWYYPSGQTYEEEYFEMGKPSNISRIYFDSTIEQHWLPLLLLNYKTIDSLENEYHRIQVQYERVYDANGKQIIQREFNRYGKLEQEILSDTDRDFETFIFYHPNGIVSSIGYHLNNRGYGHYEEYDEQGNKTKSWDYDDNGNQINRKQ